MIFKLEQPGIGFLRRNIRKAADLLFNSENPIQKNLEGIERFSGWYIPDKYDHEKMDINLLIDGVPHSKVEYGLVRQDVFDAYRHHSHSITSGWRADLIVTEKSAGKKIEVSIYDHYNNAVIYRGNYKCGKPFTQKDDRRLGGLVCPFCRKGLENLACKACDRDFTSPTGIPCFLQEGSLPIIRRSELNPTHPYGPNAGKIISQFSKGLVLDFGCGNLDDKLVYDNVIRLDVVDYKNVNVVVTTDDLPFQDNYFDAVVSQSVFEHVKRPWLIADELYRVLKPGGILYVETAFMQPLHADPHHFFNMTISGLRTVFERFAELETGVCDYQQMSYGFEMQINAILPYIKDAKAKKTFELFLDWITKERNIVDNCLEDDLKNILAAGHFYKGIKQP